VRRRRRVTFRDSFFSFSKSKKVRRCSDTLLFKTALTDARTLGRPCRRRRRV
jgi:hypothetical protein